MVTVLTTYRTDLVIYSPLLSFESTQMESTMSNEFMIGFVLIYNYL